MSQKKVLIIKLGSLGDILQSSPVIDAVYDCVQPDIIDILTFDEHRGLFDNHPKVRKVIGLKRSVYSILKIAISLFLMRYDIGLNLHRSIYLDAVFYFCGVKMRLGFSSPEKHTWFLNNSVPFNLELSRHHRYLSLVQKLVQAPLDASSYGLTYYRNPSNSRTLFDTCTPYIVVAPFGGENRYSSMPARVWPGYQALIRLLIEFHPNHQIVLTGGPSDRDSLEMLGGFFGEQVGVFQGSFDELAVLLESALCFIGNDSFPLFMAIATKCKAFAIFGPTDSERIVGPYNDVFFLQSDVSCSPCYNPLDGLKRAYHCPYSNV